MRAKTARRVDAAMWLTSYLADEGTVSTGALRAAAKGQGIRPSVLLRALDDMDVVIGLPAEVRELIRARTSLPSCVECPECHREIDTRTARAL